jgi:hypothetical protein
VNGEQYPPSTIRSLLCGISRELAKNLVPFNILDKADIRFQPLHHTLDTVNSDLHLAGIGVTTKSAEVLSKEFEELCWEKGSLGFSTLPFSAYSYFRGVQE